MSADLSIARSRVASFNMSVAAGAPAVKVEEKPLTKPKTDIQFYGGAKQLWEAVLGGEPLVMIHGPAETGKSISALHLMDYMCWAYPGSQWSLIRKIAADMPGTIIRSFEDKVINMPIGESKAPSGITKYGGERPEFYKYPTGSRVWVGGMDHPGKVLSGERDGVLVNQAEELEEQDWQTISTRTTGRAGVLVPGRLIGDCNPGPSTHWIMSHAAAGTLKMIRSVHKDNPALYDPITGQLTSQGRIRIGALMKLTGVLYKRLFKGLWVAAEGVVYDTWDPTTHNNKHVDLAQIKYFIGGIDWGLTNPGVMQVWGIDGDGRMYRFHEIYQTGKLVAASDPKDAWWILRGKEMIEKYHVQTFICDPSRPDHMEAFETSGLPCTAGFNSVELGIQNVQSRLVVQEDGLPRIMLLAGSKPEIDPTLVDRHAPTCLEEEMEVYAWPKDQQGKAKKENPVEKDNHACDTMRYVAAWVDGLGENEFMFSGGGEEN